MLTITISYAGEQKKSAQHAPAKTVLTQRQILSANNYSSDDMAYLVNGIGLIYACKDKAEFNQLEAALTGKLTDNQEIATLFDQASEDARLKMAEILSCNYKFDK